MGLLPALPPQAFWLLLPYHDYGRDGRGWWDLWQDCLSLLNMDPQGVGEMIEKNFDGVRMDGTNATIIGDGERWFNSYYDNHGQRVEG